MLQGVYRSEQFIRLYEETRKGRVGQFLTQLEIKQLAQFLTPEEGEELLRFILKQKSFFKRSIIDVYILMACIKQYKFFDDILEGKGEKALQQFCKHLYYTKLERGKYLYQIGDVADKFYILMTGSVSVQLSYKEQVIGQNGNVKIEQKMKSAMQFSKGEMFGETISKESIARRAASILTITDCEFFEVKKKDYETVNKYMTISLMREKYMFFEQIDLFSRLYKSSLEAMLYLTAPREVHMGHTLYQQGQQLEQIYIIKQGQFKLESMICGKQNESDPLAALQRRNHSNSRKFQTAIVGSKFILGQIDVLMNIPTMQSCTCITQKADLYVIKKKDLLLHILESGPIQGYIASKYYLRNKRLQNLNRNYNKNSLLSVFNHRRIYSESEKGKSKSIEIHSHSLTKMNKGEGQFFSLDKQNTIRRGSTIYSQKSKKRSRTENQESSQKSYLSDVEKITEIIKQKKKYSKLRKNNNEPLFKFSSEIPVFLRVKMGIDNNQFRLPEQKNDSSKTLTEFLSPKKLSKTMRPTRKLVKKQPRVSANSKTVYGKFFQLLLDL